MMEPTLSVNPFIYNDKGECILCIVPARRQEYKDGKLIEIEATPITASEIALSWQRRRNPETRGKLLDFDPEKIETEWDDGYKSKL